MLIVISPAKTLDYESALPSDKFTQPLFLKQSRQLITVLRRLSAEQICTLMQVSGKLSELNFQRYSNWSVPFSPENARPAIFAFKGDVYLGLKAHQFNKKDLVFAQDHLRILSGLYGLLRPLDLMQAYRLEMGTALENKKGKDLYSFWKPAITEFLAAELAAEKSPVLVNLASSEYFNALDTGKLGARIITPQFKDFSSGKYRFLSYFAKQARGSMVAYIIRKRLTDPASINGFDEAGYRYSETESSPDAPVFLRKKAA
ncbi:MAG: peroxide stress protein YaaA [Pseudohongiellaceae bacterium]